MFKRIASIEAKLLVIFMALIILSMPTSAEINNCCGVDRQCETDEQWTSGYWAFQNNQCVAPSQQGQSTSSRSQPQSEPSEVIDNCCFVDRLCMTDEQWVNGYNAYQNNQCAVPSQQQQRSTSSQSQPQSGTAEDINNCCFTGWQCSTDEEWTSGYWAFQHDQCASQSQWQEQWPQWQQQQGQQQQRQSSSEGRQPVNRTYDPDTRETIFEYEDGTEIIVRRPTQEELCEALKNLGLPLPPECEDE